MRNVDPRPGGSVPEARDQAQKLFSCPEAEVFWLRRIQALVAQNRHQGTTT